MRLERFLAEDNKNQIDYQMAVLDLKYAIQKYKLESAKSAPVGDADAVYAYHQKLLAMREKITKLREKITKLAGEM